MREFIPAAFTQSPGQYWQTLIAGEIFAEHFAEDAELRHQVVAHVLWVASAKQEETRQSRAAKAIVMVLAKKHVR